MGTFSNEFWNVTDHTDPRIGPVPPAVADGTTHTRTALQTFLDLANATAVGLTSPGGIVYLPPGAYLIERNPARQDFEVYLQQAIDTPDLVVGPNVLLWFAPGALLLMDPGVVVRIDGSIRASTLQIFKTNDPPSGSTMRRGRVIFRSARIHEVYPEWWGAASLPDTGESYAAGNTTAFEDCIRAAHTDRAFLSPIHGPGGVTGLYPVIPIILQGGYLIDHELVIEPKEARQLPDPTPGAAPGATIPDPSDPLLLESTGVANFDGIIFQGRRGTGNAGTGRPTLVAAGPLYVIYRNFGESFQTGRALLRINTLHGSIVEGVTFDGNHLASVGVQITGNNARSSTFRDCTFKNAAHVLMQVGDYVIESTVSPFLAEERSLPTLAAGLNGGWDLSGLLLDNCHFVNDRDLNQPDAASLADADSWARHLVGLVFQAINTLPMILDHCLFTGPMLACIEAYGGAMVIRGGGAQNQLPTSEYRVPAPGAIQRDRPRGGVDIFIGDPLLDPTHNPTAPTAITVIEFQSQSEQFLDTFRHISASSPNCTFYPTLLQNVMHQKTNSTRGPTHESRTPAAVFWSGPGLSRNYTQRINRGVPILGSAGTLTLVGCSFQGPRSGTGDTAVAGAVEPSGVVVVDSEVLLVGDVGTSLTFQSPSSFFRFKRVLLPTENRYEPASLGDVSSPAWYRGL